MRNTLAPLALLAALAGAVRAEDDDAADLYYRACWLEQAAAKIDDAEALYQRILREHEDAPEAPRALAALIRIRLGRGKGADDLVALLKRRYPQADEEIALTRKLAAREVFDPVERPEDTPAERKVKVLYVRLINSEEIADEDRAFLADLGTGAHPMLRHLLRAPDAGPVQEATQILLLQRTPEARAEIEAALRDETVLFRTAVVAELADHTDLPVSLIRAIGDLQASAAPRLRATVTRVLATLVTSEGDARAEVFKLLTKSLSDPDPEVRSYACVVDPTAPDEYAWAALARLEKDPDPNKLEILPHFAHLEGYAERAERLLRDQALVYAFGQRGIPEHEEGRLLLARRIASEAPRRWDHRESAYRRALANASKGAAAYLIRVALERGDRELATAGDPGAAADELRAAALAATYDVDAGRRAAAEMVLSRFRLGPAHLDAIVAEARKRPGEPLPAAVGPGFLNSVGPERSLALVPLCTTSGAIGRLLADANGAFLENRTAADDATVAFYEALIPKIGPEHANLVVVTPRLASVVCKRLLAARESGWLWNVPGRGVTAAGPTQALMSRVTKYASDEPLRSLFLGHAADDRREFGGWGVQIAKEAAGEAGTAALVRAFDSPWEDLRAHAMFALAERGEAGADALVAYLQRDGVERKDRETACKALVRCGQAKHGTALRDLLAKRPEDSRALWNAYHALQPDEAVLLALDEALGEAGPGFRLGAVQTLAKTSHVGRIGIFRRILKESGDTDIVLTVLRTVKEQYLIELGQETLLHLRSPDAAVRTEATEAIDRLKFYAEAKRAVGG